MFIFVLPIKQSITYTVALRQKRRVFHHLDLACRRCKEVIILEPNHMLVLRVAGGHIFYVLEQRLYKLLIGLLGFFTLPKSKSTTIMDESRPH